MHLANQYLLNASNGYDTNLTNPINTGEIFAVLNNCKDTSPGADKILYRELKEVDPRCEILEKIFNHCFKEHMVPDHWKVAETILPYKKGDKMLPENWRPIALSNTIYKVYTGILAKRLSRIEGLISPEQKGFCRADGTGEHTAVLQNAIHQAVNNSGEMVICWLDLSNAFGSIPHAVLDKVLDGYGFPRKFKNVIRKLYEKSYTIVKTSKGRTKAIKIRAGVKQGDPISPILFNLCMEPIIREFKKTFKNPLNIRGLEISILAFADDLVIVAKNAEEMCNAQTHGGMDRNGGTGLQPQKMRNVAP